MMGTVVRVDCAVGDSVSPETVVIVIESMKMEVPIESGAAGVVQAVRCNVGDLVDLDADQLVAAVHRHPDRDRAVVADRVAHPLERLALEPCAVGERSAVAVGTPVGVRR